jgi:RNA polymerase sigma factor (sigma-70 family)
MTGRVGVPESNDEDFALSRRAAAGDHAAFATLVEKHERKLRAFLSKAFGAQHADDIAQDAFLKAWRSARQYDGRARYSTWLTRIAWRCRIDAVRKERPVEVDHGARTDTVQPSGEIEDMLARLTEKERVALILCEGHGWTHAEAAELLGMPLGTLKSVIARAKMKCRAMWEGADHG